MIYGLVLYRWTVSGSTPILAVRVRKKPKLRRVDHNPLLLCRTLPELDEYSRDDPTAKFPAPQKNRNI